MMDSWYKSSVGRVTVGMANTELLDSSFNPAGLVIWHIMRDSHDGVRCEALTNKQESKVQAVPVNDSTKHQRGSNLSVCRPTNRADMPNCERVPAWLTWLTAVEWLYLQLQLIFSLHLQSVKRNTYLEYTFGLKLNVFIKRQQKVLLLVPARTGTMLAQVHLVLRSVFFFCSWVVFKSK